MPRSILRAAPFRRILTAADPEVMIQLVRLVILYEDLELEVAGPNIPKNRELDEVSKHYREMDFVRRAFATLREMDSAFHKLSMLLAFKERKRALDLVSTKEWNAAIHFLPRQNTSSTVNEMHTAVM